MKELILALMAWANASTGLPVPEALPNVVNLSHCEMQREFSGNPDADCDNRSMYVAAMYRPYDGPGTIYILDTWNAARLTDVSTLLHEVVHHMQAAQGMTAGTVHCVGQDVELPAYQAQFHFLKQAGVDDPMAALGIGEIAFRIATGCRRGY